MRRRSRLLSVVVGVGGLVVASLAMVSLAGGPAGAITLSPLAVDNPGDGVAVPTNCSPTPVAGQCTLRDAFAAASTGGGSAAVDVVINIPASVGPITLTSGSLAYNGGTGGAHALSVVGNGNTITASATGRIITSTTTGMLTVTGLTLTGGSNVCRGGAIRASEAVTVNSSTISNNSSTCGGGGVFAGSLTATGSTFTGNHANGGSGGAIETQADGAPGTVSLVGTTVSSNTARNGGGGINADGLATVTRSTIDHNLASQGSAGDGGGLEAGSVVMTNSTITNNSDPGDPGGGIYISGGAGTLDYVTVANNSSGTGANIAHGVAGATLTSFGSVVANPLGGGTNCEGTTSSSMGFNWDQDGSCHFATATDHSPGGNAQLGALAANGGPTQTLLPQQGSGLIDAIPPASCQADGASGITTDQRGVARPQGAGCDIGAVEVAAPIPILVTPRFTG